MTSVTGAATYRVLPTDLIDSPQVTALLDRLGLGALPPEAITARPGRNNNWAGTTTTGAHVFVKQMGKAEPDGREALRRALAFEGLAARPAGPLRAPDFLGADDRHMVFTLVPRGRTGVELAEDGDFDVALARSTGAAIGFLHDLPVSADMDDSTPATLPFGWLTGLPWGSYTAASAATLELWRLVHADPELVAAVHRIAEREAVAPRTPAHCDLRLDQLLVDGPTLYVTDWEEFRCADPARDVGSFAGEWLHRAVLRLPSGAQHSLDPDEVVAHGVRELERVQPIVAAFWEGYRSAREPDQGLVLRATALAGWHLYDRLLVGTTERPRMTASQLAAAGIGRTLLLQPDSSAEVLGLAGSTS